MTMNGIKPKLSYRTQSNLTVVLRSVRHNSRQILRYFAFLDPLRHNCIDTVQTRDAFYREKLKNSLETECKKWQIALVNVVVT